MPATVAPLTLDPETDELRPIGALMHSLTGRRPAPPTIYRWIANGTVRAGRLPAIRVYGSWHTTREALIAWLSTESQRPLAATADAPSERDPATERRLRKAGLLSD